MLEYETVDSANFKDSLTHLLDPIPEPIQEKPKQKKRRKSNPTTLGSPDPVPVK